jgi:hypothetical protein
MYVAVISSCACVADGANERARIVNRHREQDMATDPLAPRWAALKFCFQWMERTESGSLQNFFGEFLFQFAGCQCSPSPLSQEPWAVVTLKS